MELVHAKMGRGRQGKGKKSPSIYQLTFVFGSPIKSVDGGSIGKAKPIHMSFLEGMGPNEFTMGLRALADHVEREFNPLKEGHKKEG